MHPDKIERLESVLWRFEDAWRSPVPPDPEDFLLDIAEADRSELLHELIAIDLEHRIRRQPNATSDRYPKKFPEIYAAATTRNELVRHELKLRSKFGQFPTESEFQARFANESSFHAIRSTMADESPQAIPLGDSIECGTRIGSYVIEERIGGGAFADVYRAKDSLLNRMAALKFLKTWSHEAEHLRARMLREAQAVATLQHPHVVPVFETGSVDGHDYIASRFIDGPTLNQWTREFKPDFHQSVSVVAKLASALDAAHCNGIIHRDVKPDNVMMHDGNPMLLDFGLAHLGTASVALTHEGDIVGTPAYMSPEQANGVREVGPASDIYSLGVVLYQMITHKLPFEGSTPALLHSTIHEDPTPPRKINSAIPVDLQTVCLKGMSKSPSERYTTAQQMADDLWKFYHGDPVTARPISAAEKTARRIRKYPIASTLALLLLVSMGVGLGVAIQYQGVVLERNRATAAEATTQGLLARDAAVSGLLAQRRGQTQVAVERFREAIERGYVDESDLQISIAECELVNGNFDRVSKALERANGHSVSEDVAARVKLIQLQLVLEGAIDDEALAPITLLRNIDSQQLSESNRYFLAGLDASTSERAFDNFVLAYELDPHHYAARRLAAITAFTLADFEQALAICETTDQIFPKHVNVSFSLIALLAYSALGDDEQVAKILAEQPDKEERVAWQAASDFVSDLCQRFDTGELRVFKDDKIGEAELTLAQMDKMLDEFINRHLSLFRKNHWFLPPRIEGAFHRFQLAVAGQVDQQNSLFGGLTGKFSGVATELRDSGIALVDAHPEASLTTTIARHALDKAGGTLEVTIQVQQFYEAAIDSKSFLSGTRKHALIGSYLSAMALSRFHKHDVESNSQRANQVLQMIDPESVNDAALLRALSLSQLQDNTNWQAAGRFIPRWVTVAKQSDDSASIMDSLWHNALFLRSQENWYFVLTTCDELLERFPERNFPPPIDPQGLKVQAMSQLAHVIDIDAREFDWQDVLTNSLIDKDWRLARAAMGQLGQRKETENSISTEVLESIVVAFETSEFDKVAQIIEQLPTKQLESARLSRLLEHARQLITESQQTEK